MSLRMTGVGTGREHGRRRDENPNQKKKIPGVASLTLVQDTSRLPAQEGNRDADETPLSSSEEAGVTPSTGPPTSALPECAPSFPASCLGWMRRWRTEAKGWATGRLQAVREASKAPPQSEFSWQLGSSTPAGSEISRGLVLVAHSAVRLWTRVSRTWARIFRIRICTLRFSGHPGWAQRSTSCY